MQDDARKLTYGAMMVAIFVILISISVFVPLVGTITMIFSPLPIILYRVRYDRTASLFVLIAGMLLTLIGGFLLIPVAFVMGTFGFVVGEALVQHKSKLYTFMASGLTFLMTTLLLYVVTVMFLNLNMIDEIARQLQDTQAQMMALLERTGEVPENFSKQLQDTFDYAFKAIPGAFILTSFVVGFGLLAINLPIVQRLGHPVPKFPPFRMMKLPLHTVWAYMVIFLIPLFTKMESGSNLELIYINGTFILRFLFLLQGISFVHHITHTSKLPKPLTIVFTLVAILLNPLTIIVGILDTGINIREWIGKNKSK